MEIRKALKKDLNHIAKIYHTEATKKPYLQKRTSQEALKIINTHFKKANIYIAITKNKIVGFIIVNLRFGGDDLYVGEMWLKSKYQRKGIGKSLMEFVEEKYKKVGIKSITLIAGKKSGAAYGFYKKLKFKVIDELALMRKKVIK